MLVFSGFILQRARVCVVLRVGRALSSSCALPAGSSARPPAIITDPLLLLL
jgi:hypothetical protein